MQRKKTNIRRKKEKVTALFITFCVVALSLMNVSDWGSVGIYPHVGLLQRCIYPFFHANVFHALLNGWCLINIVFVYNVSIGRLLLSYVVAATYPIDAIASLVSLSATPTVGLSGIIFVLLGSVSLSVARKIYFQVWMWLFLIVGFFLSSSNALLHVYCYVIGLIYAVVNYPMICKKR